MNKIFTYICTLLAVFITISGLLSLKSLAELPFQLIFLPITIYLIIASFNHSADHSSSKTPIVIFGLIFILIFGYKLSQIMTASSQPSSISNFSPSPTPTPTPTPTQQKINTVTTTAESDDAIINIRETPSTTAKILSKTKPNITYTKIDSQDDWVKINIDDNSTGWINTKYIK